MTARVLLVVSCVACASVSRAAEVTRVVSALDDENQFDFNLTASWLHESKSAFIKRESETGPAGLIKDSEYSQTRDILDLKMDFGILWDVGLHIDLPIVLADNRTLEFDQSAGSGCVFPGMAGGTPTCVDQNNSTILRDGILPSTRDMDGKVTSWGLGNQYTQGKTLFKGPTRKGLEDLGLGLTWAVFNQLRDDTRPTWTLTFDARLDIFKDMRFDPANPNANTAVGPGYHKFIWSSFVSKRFRYFDPYFGAWYLLPVRTNGSIYSQVPNGNQTAVNPQQRAGIVAGVEQIAWENPRGAQRVTVEARGRASEHFFGRSASEIWEPLVGNPACSTAEPASCRAGIDGNPPLPGGTPTFSPHPGVTETQQYASYGGDAILNVQVGKYVRFRGVFGMTWDMPHFITFASPGKDRNGDGVAATSDPTEANVNYREALDAPGRRFKVEGSQTWNLFFEGSLMF